MKYILPLIISLFFTACNNSDKTANEKMSVNSTSIEQAVTQVEEEKPDTKPAQENAKAEMNGETIFSKCKGCHGNSAEKKALGSSQIIKGWDVSKIEEALHGYKNGTYGAKMKNIMSAQAKGLSDEEIKKVAVYIHSL
ncbi:c-type cytochrome [Sulfurimonas sp. HSL-1716]|uniref:c-type cytochrome n=1 Tax=Hydrocurvibacter sulfurireducens TaxID=3131937 RepID=UPI0031F80952